MKRMTAMNVAAILFYKGDDCMIKDYKTGCLEWRKSIIQYVACIIFFCTALFLQGIDSFAATVLSANGALKVEGTKLVSQKTGKQVQLRGVSTHGINWDVGYPYISKDAFKTLRDKYSVNAIRLAMYTTEYYGYCDKGGAGESQSTVQSTLKTRIDTGVQAATDLGMYVIIDWHILNDQTPKKYQSQAKDFFTEMSLKYADYDNVIYEICNEPNGGTTWSDIKSYANTIIPVIRANDSDAVIIVGTPTWSQDVDVASKSPLKYDNVMYTLHFYSATHTDYYREKLKMALNNGLPIMVTEFGVSEASGNGSMNTSEAKKWLDLLDSNKISYFAWSLSSKDETASLLKAGTTKTSGWTTSQLSPAGKWILTQYNKRSDKNTTSYKPDQVNKVAIKNVKGKKAKITIKKVSKATGYQIIYSTNRKFKKASSVKTTKNSYTIKNLKKKTYYIKVRAYRKVNEKTYYGVYSKVVKINIKK